METSFSKKVYELVKKIPKGKVLTYEEIAAKLGKPRAARAVGNALHQNPDSQNIPCHRVVDRNGRLAANYAFGGGEEQRKRLLSEGIKFKDKNHIIIDQFLISNI